MADPGNSLVCVAGVTFPLKLSQLFVDFSPKRPAQGDNLTSYVALTVL